MYHFNEVYVPGEQKTQESSSLWGGEKRKKQRELKGQKNIQFKSYLKNQQIQRKLHL